MLKVLITQSLSSNPDESHIVLIGDHPMKQVAQASLAHCNKLIEFYLKKGYTLVHSQPKPKKEKFTLDIE